MEEPPDPYASVVGQDPAVSLLRSSAARPVHAYLLVGPHGSGKEALALAFAADLLARAQDEPAAARTRRLVAAGHHPDVVVVGAEATAVRRVEADRLREAASRSPVEGARKVLIGVGFDVIQPEAAALLLKTIEEPGPSMIFVLLAEDVPPELVTIASRCLRVDLAPLAPGAIRSVLEAEAAEAGWSPQQVDRAVEAAAGDLRRARLLAADERFGLRHDAWLAVPARLDGDGATVHRQVEELLSMIEEATAPLEARHAVEREEVEAEAEAYGMQRGSQRELVERQRRQLRRFREQELRSGLRLLASRYRDAAVHERLALQDASGAVAAIDELGAELIRHPNERLQLQALFLRLPPVPD